MNAPLSEFALLLGGRRVEAVWDRVRRYCGLPWSGGTAETWAYRYYDSVDSDAGQLTPIDVLSAAALHPGLSRTDLAYFWDRAEPLMQWLRPLPADLPLRDADDSVIRYLAELADWADAPSITLLTKVLHRKRPALIPLLDRHVLDWYRAATGERTAKAAWPLLLPILREDLGNRGIGAQNALLLAIMNVELEKELPRPITHLRLVDIAIWMASR